MLTHSKAGRSFGFEVCSQAFGVEIGGSCAPVFCESLDAFGT